MTHTLDNLFATIEARKSDAPEVSYTSKLLHKGVPHIAKKLGEEAVETAIAATSVHMHEVVKESADVLYHLLVLWAAMGIKPDDVWAELAQRESQSGLAEKASRKE